MAKEKNILMIGGSSGIGLAIAQQLAATHNIIIASRNADNLSNLDVEHITFDVLKDELETSALPEEIHGFVYCPGSINLRPQKMLKQEDYRADMELNYFGLVKTIQKIYPQLKKGKASIVVFSTVASKLGMPFHTSIAGAKGAVEAYAKALAAESAPTLRINIIAPSLTDTPLAGKLLDNDAKKEKMGERHPLKRVGTAEDIANLACFLLEDKSSWITGQVIGVDGGLSTLNIN